MAKNLVLWVVIAMVLMMVFKNFGNPAIRKMIEENDVRLSKWDFAPRTCTVVGIQQKLLEDNNGEEN